MSQQHRNFAGTPTHKDWLAIYQLRGVMTPMTGILEKLAADMQMAMHNGTAVDWPHLRHQISAINSHLNSVNRFLNGSYKHVETTVPDTKGNPQTVYRDEHSPGKASTLEALHVYPQAPYPLGEGPLADMAAHLLMKRLMPAEQKWVEERIRKASEFAHVPGEWGIEAPKPAAEEDEEEDEDADIEIDVSMTRVKCSLSEDEIAELWANGHRSVFDRDHQDQEELHLGIMGEGKAKKGEGEEAKVEGEEEGSEDGGSDEEMGEDEKGEVNDDEEKQKQQEPPRPPPVAMIQSSAPVVHKGVPGAPVMALGVLHRFMMSGEVQQPAVKR